jgi:hypothetical protein
MSRAIRNWYIQHEILFGVVSVLAEGGIEASKATRSFSACYKCMVLARTGRCMFLRRAKISVVIHADI